MEDTHQKLIDEILALKLLNPVSAVDVEPDDIYAYIDEADAPPCVDGFKAWLRA